MINHMHDLFLGNIWHRFLQSAVVENFSYLIYTDVISSYQAQLN